MNAFKLLLLSVAWTSVQSSTDLDPSNRRQHVLRESSCTLLETCVIKQAEEDDEHSWVCELSKDESSRIHAEFADIDDSNPKVADIILHATSGETKLKFTEAIVTTEDGREPIIHFPETSTIDFQEDAPTTSETGGLAFSSIGTTPNANQAPPKFGNLTALFDGRP